LLNIQCETILNIKQNQWTVLFKKLDFDRLQGWPSMSYAFVLVSKVKVPPIGRVSFPNSHHRIKYIIHTRKPTWLTNNSTTILTSMTCITCYYENKRLEVLASTTMFNSLFIFLKCHPFSLVNYTDISWFCHFSLSLDILPFSVLILTLLIVEKYYISNLHYKCSNTLH